MNCTIALANVTSHYKIETSITNFKTCYVGICRTQRFLRFQQFPENVNSTNRRTQRSSVKFRTSLNPCSVARPTPEKMAFPYRRLCSDCRSQIYCGVEPHSRVQETQLAVGRTARRASLAFEADEDGGRIGASGDLGTYC